MDYFSIIVFRRGLFTASHEHSKINVLLAVFLVVWITPVYRLH